MARSFNGSTDKGKDSSGSNLSFGDPQAFAVSAWINFTSGGGGHIAAKGYAAGSNTTNWEMNAGTTSVNFQTFANGTTRGATYNPGASNGIWYHIYGEYDGTQWNIYWNGSLVAQSGATAGAATTNVAASVGCVVTDSFGDVQFFTGNISQVAIWDVSLTTTQITALANGACPGLINLAHLKAWWPLGADGTDASGNGNDLTFTGTSIVDDPIQLYQQPFWFDAIPPKAQQRAVEYPAAFWTPRDAASLVQRYASVFDALPPKARQRLIDYPAFFWDPLGGYNNPAPPKDAIPPAMDAANPRAPARPPEYQATAWMPTVLATVAVTPAALATAFTDLPPRAAQRLAEYQATFWNPLGGYTNPAPPKFAIPPGVDAANPRAAQRLIEYPASFWTPQAASNLVQTYASAFFDLPPKAAARPPVYPALSWNPQTFTNPAPPAFNFPGLYDLPPRAAARLAEYQAVFQAHRATFTDPAPPTFAIPPIYANPPQAARRLADYPHLAWAPQPFSQIYASAFTDLPPRAAQRLVEYQSFFFTPQAQSFTQTPSALWIPTFPSIVLPAQRLVDYTQFVLPYLDFGGSVTPPAPTTQTLAPIYGPWPKKRRKEEPPTLGEVERQITAARNVADKDDFRALRVAELRIQRALDMLTVISALENTLRTEQLYLQALKLQHKINDALEERDVEDLMKLL